MFVNLLSGTAMTLTAQAVTDMNLAENSVQGLAFTKFVATVLLTSLIRPAKATTPAAQKRPQASESTAARQPQFSLRARRIMFVIGCLDVISYGCHCVGFAICGAATGSVIFAAAAQTLTALLTRFVLGKRLQAGQVIAVALVLGGILIRGGGGDDLGGQSSKQALGYAALGAAALGYSLLGIVYDKLISTETPAPSHADIMLYAGKIGLVASIMYQVVWTLPRWHRLIATPLHRSGYSLWSACLAFAIFGVVYVLHTFAQGAVQRSQGALGVGLVSAVRSATVGVGASLIFCRAGARSQCLTPRSAASAAIVTLGGIVWVVSGHFAKPSQTKKKAQ